MFVRAFPRPLPCSSDGVFAHRIVYCPCDEVLVTNEIRIIGFSSLSTLSDMPMLTDDPTQIQNVAMKRQIHIMAKEMWIENPSGQNLYACEPGRLSEEIYILECEDIYSSYWSRGRR